MINSHTLFKELVAIGFTKPQAEKLSELAIDKNVDSLATKKQVESVKDQVDALEKEQVDIKTDIKFIKNDIANIKENMATKSDLIKTEAKITEAKFDILKWVIPLLVGNTGVMIALLVKITH